MGAANVFRELLFSSGAGAILGKFLGAVDGFNHHANDVAQKIEKSLKNRVFFLFCQRATRCPLTKKTEGDEISFIMNRHSGAMGKKRIVFAKILLCL